ASTIRAPPVAQGLTAKWDRAGAANTKKGSATGIGSPPGAAFWLDFPERNSDSQTKIKDSPLRHEDIPMTGRTELLTAVLAAADDVPPNDPGPLPGALAPAWAARDDDEGGGDVEEEGKDEDEDDEDDDFDDLDEDDDEFDDDLDDDEFDDDLDDDDLDDDLDDEEFDDEEFDDDEDDEDEDDDEEEEDFGGDEDAAP